MYIVNLKYFQKTEKGLKRKIEQYLVDAVSVTDSEVKVTEHFKSNEDIQDLSISGTRIFPISDMILEGFNEASDIIYAGRASNKEAKIKASFLTFASEQNINEALDRSIKYFQDHCSIDAISNTRIILDSNLCKPITGEMLNF